MKATQLFIFITTIVLCSVGAARAEEEDRWYAGVKAGRMDIDITEFDHAIGVGGLLGYKLSNTLGIEGGYSTTGKDGNVNIGTTRPKWNIDVVALHLAYRNEGRFYVKGKAGILYQEVSVSLPNANEPASSSEASLGLGVGWRPAKDLALELEYTVIETDISFISFGINLGI